MERQLPRRVVLVRVLIVVCASFTLGQMAILAFNLQSWFCMKSRINVQLPENFDTKVDLRLRARNAMHLSGLFARADRYHGDGARAVFSTESRPIDWQQGARPACNSTYHKRWDVDCPAILSGDKDEVTKANGMLQTLRDDAGKLPIPSDKKVNEWIRNCSDYRLNRHYPDQALSNEEEAYPLAYIINIHEEIAQVERLLRSIYQPQNIYCFHPDSKSPDSFQTAIRKLSSCFDNVFIASKIETVILGGFSRLKADINCMEDFLKDTVKWKYVMTLSGKDFPLKTNLEIVRQLKAYNGHNDISGVLPSQHLLPRTAYHYKMRRDRPMRTKIEKSPPPHNLTIFTGNSYYAATREFVDFVVNDRVAVDLLEWSKDTYSPSDHYWVTLQRSSYAPGGFPEATWEQNIKFMKWRNDKSPGCQGLFAKARCIFGIGYLDYLHKQPYLFANKFDYSYDPIAMQCMEEVLDNRTWLPEESRKLINFPVKDMSWQRYVPA